MQSLVGRKAWRGRLAILAVLVGLAFLVAACGGAAKSGTLGTPVGGSTPTLLPGERVEDGVIITEKPGAVISTFPLDGWRTDFKRHTVPYDELISGGPPKDGIPAIDNPKFVAFPEADAWLQDGEPVALVQVNGDVKAYPLQILIWHEIVNDVIGGEPIAVTFCPLCNTTIAFRRTLAGQVLDFGTTGNLRFSDLVMYDRQTETWWQQATAEGIIGTHAGRHLEFYPSSVISYADFKASFPQGRVLSRETGFIRDYGANPYVRYDYASSTPFLYEGPPIDGRLAALERVVTIDHGGEAVAYPFSVLEKERAVNDVVGGQSVVVLFKPGAKSVLDQPTISNSKEIGAGVAFSREVSGQVLTFQAQGERFRDRETGSTWDITGKATEGPLTGSQLTSVVHSNHFWFSWAVFKPETRVYQGGGR